MEVTVEHNILFLFAGLSHSSHSILFSWAENDTWGEGGGGGQRSTSLKGHNEVSQIEPSVKISWKEPAQFLKLWKKFNSFNNR